MAIATERTSARSASWRSPQRALARDLRHGDRHKSLRAPDPSRGDRRRTGRRPICAKAMAVKNSGARSAPWRSPRLPRRPTRPRGRRKGRSLIAPWICAPPRASPRARAGVAELGCCVNPIRRHPRADAHRARGPRATYEYDVLGEQRSSSERPSRGAKLCAMLRRLEILP